MRCLGWLGCFGDQGKKGREKIERREEIGIQLLNLTEKKLLEGVVVVDDAVDGDKLVSGKSSVSSSLSSSSSFRLSSSS